MRVDIIFPTGDKVLSTSANTTVRFDAGSVRLHARKTSKIELYYAKGNEPVPGSYPENATPNTLIGMDYNNGVTVNEEGIALFKVKPNCLSSQHIVIKNSDSRSQYTQTRRLSSASLSRLSQNFPGNDL